MKKTIIITVFIIFIPFLIVSVFINEKEIDFNLVSETTIRVKRNEKNVIETIPFEEYIVGVVAGEMPVSFNIEALKAQSVAARNYAYKKMLNSTNEDYDVIDTTANQVYLDLEQLKDSWKTNYVTNINKVRQAVSSTVGEYLTYENNIIDVFYFSTSNGKTEDALTVFNVDVPYLKSVDSPWDEEENARFNYKATFTIDEFCTLLSINCTTPPEIKDIVRDTNNRVTDITINKKTFKGTEIYKLLKIRSTDFEIEQKDKEIIINTKGYGHGVGMSQYGANGMAKKGYNYKQILTHYYQGTTLKKF